MLNSIHTQIKIILEKKIAIVVFFTLMLMVLANYFENIKLYHGQDTNVLIHPMRMLMLSADEYDTSSLKFVFLQFYPILVILPAGFSYVTDVFNRTDIYLISRYGKKKYFLGKMIAVFIVTFVVFSVPFFTEMLLNVIAFPSEANGNFANAGLYEDLYVQQAERYLYLGMYIISPYLYAFITIFIFGIVSSVLSVFTLALSIFINKYKVFLLFPVYLLLYGLGALYSIIPGASIHTSHFEYFALFDASQKN